MINKLISAICVALNTEFGDNYAIYKESIEQGLEEPCFFVKTISPTSSNTIKYRRQRELDFMIQYFPSTDNVNYECNEAVDRLIDCLNDVTVDNCLIHMNIINSKVVDKVLNHQIRCKIFEINPTTEEMIETYNINTEVGE